MQYGQTREHGAEQIPLLQSLFRLLLPRGPRPILFLCLYLCLSPLLTSPGWAQPSGQSSAEYQQQVQHFQNDIHKGRYAAATTQLQDLIPLATQLESVAQAHSLYTLGQWALGIGDFASAVQAAELNLKAQTQADSSAAEHQRYRQERQILARGQWAQIQMQRGQSFDVQNSIQDVIQVAQKPLTWKDYPAAFREALLQALLHSSQWGNQSELGLSIASQWTQAGLPLSPESHRLAGRLALQRGDLKLAQAHLQAAQDAFAARQSASDTALRDFQHFKNRLALDRAELTLQRGDFKTAREIAQQAFQLTHANDPQLLSDVFVFQAQSFYLYGHMTSAESYLNMAQQQAQKLKLPARLFALHLQLAEIYRYWQMPTRALSQIQQIQPLLNDLSEAHRLRYALMLAELHFVLGHDKQGQEFLKQASTQLEQASNGLAPLAAHEARLKWAELELRWGQTDGLTEAFAEMAQWAQNNELTDLAARAQAGWGQALLQQGQLQPARARFQTAIDLTQTQKYHPQRADWWASLGSTFLHFQQWPQAQQAFQQALDEMDEYASVKGRLARAFLDRAFPLAVGLSQALVQQNESVQALRVLEAHRGLQLTQDMRFDFASERDLAHVGGDFVWARQYWQSMPAQSTVLLYAGLPSVTSTRAQNAEGILALSLNSPDQHQGSQNIQAVPLKRAVKAQVLAPQKCTGIQSADTLSALLQRYRKLLHNPKSDAAQRQAVSQCLYRQLIAPLEPQLAQTQGLMIVPDGPLGLIPFESLQDAQGRYLIEKYAVSYAPSLAVLNDIAQRPPTQGQRPILAWGNAQYGDIDYELEPVITQADVLLLQQQLWQYPERNTRELYGALYGLQWSPLPASAQELKALAQIWPQGRFVQGSEVQENSLKHWAQQDELRQYRILHFATHGIAVPEIPALSALVLSQPAAGDEDNYLRLPEIAQLPLDADLVNLSACETAVGKVFQGEGVYGLTQAFLTAGARQVSASLWQINDQSTAQLMTVMYRQAQSTGDFTQALTQTKRRFIAGDFGETYRHPYYWSPFVLYGPGRSGR